jgi:hypothetical protein
MPDLSPSEILTAAAKLLRERATAIAPAAPATAQPWHVKDCAGQSETGGDCPCIVALTQYDDSSGFGVSTRYVADAETPGYARWIALMHPGVGLALADWLERAARSHDALVQAAHSVWPDDPEAADRHIAEETNRHALLLARQLLGGES